MFVSITQNRVDHNTLRIQGFYQEEKNSLDIVFVGSSEVFTGYSPAYAYGKCGFTSYNISVESNRLEFFESQIKEVLSRQDPKLIVVEISDAVNEWNADSDRAEFLATLRKYTDRMPISLNKIDTINEFVDEQKLSYYFPFIMYHGQLSNLGGARTCISQDLRGTTYLKGAISTNHKTDYVHLIDIKNDYDNVPLSISSQERLYKLLDYCRTLDCKVLFTHFPRRIENETDYTEYLQRNTVEKIICDNGFDFVNLERLSDDIQIDSLNDYYDNGHLNALGQMKLTEYLGKLINKKYKIVPQRLSALNKENWEKSYTYINLFYDYYKLHEDGPEEWWYEKPALIDSLDQMMSQKDITSTKPTD